MIKEEVLTTCIRFYGTDTPEEYEDYTAVCHLTYESSSIVFIKAMCGDLNRKQLRKLLHYFLQKGVCTVKAHRSPKHTLPYAVEKDGVQTIDLLALAQKLTNKEQNGNC